MSNEKYEALALEVPEKDAPCTNCGEQGLLFYESSVGGIICQSCGCVVEANQVRHELEPEADKKGDFRPSSLSVTGSKNGKYPTASGQNLNKVSSLAPFLI